VCGETASELGFLLAEGFETAAVAV
jgi:hypothetical protein